MTVDELYNYITSQMKPEEALKKLLESSLIRYEKLKFAEGETVHPLFIITMAALDMGWDFAVESNVDTVRGLTVGTKEYMDKYFHDIAPNLASKDINEN